MANRINIPQFSGPQQVMRKIDGVAGQVLGFDANAKLASIDPSTLVPVSEVLTTPIITGGLTASGSGSNDYSASTGTFLTSSGANTLSGAVSINDATTPSVTTATGKTNTGFVTVLGKTSGGLKLTAADATAQTVTMTTAAQTVGAATITIPDLAGTSVTPVYTATSQTLTNKTLTAPVIGVATGTSLAVTGLLTSSSPSAGIGYATGAGSTVTQGTDKTTTVVINAVCGTITTVNTTLNAGVETGFTVTNSAVAANDVPVIAIKSGATANSYNVGVDAVAAGSFHVYISNLSAGNLGEALVLNFAVIKAVAA